MLKDYQAAYRFDLINPEFGVTELVPQQAEIIGSRDHTIIYLRNPDPIDSLK